ncbi:MAG: prolipoprotein diacylglyceryl transferase [Litorilinea sp.]|nr:MAG: prolipoprotein diacylglyceryl transferase [Litorilinea sp.]
MNPVIVQLGPFALHWYGVFIVGGAVIAAWIASRYAAQAGESPDHIWNLLAWTLVFGIIGARLYHVFSSPAAGGGWAYYRANPIEAINFWNGGFRGLGIYGGLIGGTVAVVLYTWWQKLDWLKYLDFIAPNVLLAQAIGRMGNFVNQELYGPPTDLPWAFHINPRYPCMVPENLPAGVQICGSSNLTQETLAWYATNGFHPTFFYEAGWNLLMFGLVTWILWRFGHRLRRGDAVLLYLIAYPLGRFWVEMFRPDAWTLGALATAQWLAMVGITLGIGGLLWRHWRWRAGQHPQETLAYLRS